MPRKKSSEAVPEKPKAKSSGFLASLAKSTGITYVPVNELLEKDTTTYTDTGSLSLNALISGSLHGGIPSDTIVGLAGEKGTGKTYVCLSVAKYFLDQHPNGYVFYYDTEAAVKPGMILQRGLPEDRFFLQRVNTVEEFRLQAVRTVNSLMEDYTPENRPPVLMVLDSLGNISTIKELKEAAVDIEKQTKDMTKAQLIRSVFRVLAIKLAEANIPLLVTNHVGVKIGARTMKGQPPPMEMSGGEGLKFAASTILILTKSRLYNKITKATEGVTMTAALYKSRHTIEYQKAQTQLFYATGLERYYGLFDMAKRFGLVSKSGNGFKFNVGGEQKQFFTKDIDGDPEQGIKGHPEDYFTEEVLAALEEKIKSSMCYGGCGIPADESDEVEFEIDGEIVHE